MKSIMFAVFILAFLPVISQHALIDSCLLGSNKFYVKCESDHCEFTSVDLGIDLLSVDIMECQSSGSFYSVFGKVSLSEMYNEKGRLTRFLTKNPVSISLYEKKIAGERRGDEMYYIKHLGSTNEIGLFKVDFEFEQNLWLVFNCDGYYGLAIKVM